MCTDSSKLLIKENKSRRVKELVSWINVEEYIICKHAKVSYHLRVKYHIVIMLRDN